MNSRERIAAVVALEQPDRVPVAPLIDHFAATYAGISNAELMDHGDKRIAAVLKTMRELGPWDMTFIADTANAYLLKMGVLARLRLPGHELPANEIHQFVETEFLKPEDYDLLIKLGFFRFMMAVTGRNHPELAGVGNIFKIISSLLEMRRHRQMVEAAGAVLACGFIHPGPLFEAFSFGRGLGPISLDLFDRPEKIKAASQAWVQASTRMAILTARFIGEPRIFIGLSRSSPVNISPAHFEEFVMPELEYMIHAFMDAGVTPLLHCDSDWTRSFPMFKRFPAKKCILELDGFSDIFKAKEVLGDHMCIMGDVPAYLQAFGSKDEVMAYCKRLIEEVGKGGGFILSTGCSIPANAKPENVKALAEAVEEWGWY
ncbi:MAG: hypothetical protein A2V67_06210 [Deltaproteobacteria bacterium RBG_13_61_14]|nr:MAG: hypothetical protein A2V67_06210 [Deltaproteobacteria bacterium RBG_13_61_14]